MPKTPKPAKKTVVKKPVSRDQAVTQTKPRRIHLPAYKPFRFKHIKHPVSLPSVWQLSRKVIELLWRHRWLFLELAVVYGVLDVLLVRGFSSVNVNSLKHQLSQSSGGKTGQLGISLSVFTNLLTSSGSNSSVNTDAYQIFLGLIISLATIWALRQVIAGEKVRLRDLFYRGMYPLIPFILVLLVILLQTLPFLIGGGLYNLVVTNGIAIHLTEKLLWGLLFAVLTFISIYMLCSSVFALYIVTLPEMTPMKALRSARQLVRYRRPVVFRKLLYLPVVLLIIVAVIMVPIIIFLAPIAPWVLFILVLCALIIVHTYMYTLYRELLL
jgi:hypothetical protein